MKVGPEMVLPFGKHKGKSIEDLPTSYLTWLAENVSTKDELGAAVVESAEQELKFREDNPEQQYDE